MCQQLPHQHKPLQHFQLPLLEQHTVQVRSTSSGCAALQCNDLLATRAQVRTCLGAAAGAPTTAMPWAAYMAASPMCQSTAQTTGPSWRAPISIAASAALQPLPAFQRSCVHTFCVTQPTPFAGTTFNSRASTLARAPATLCWWRQWSTSTGGAGMAPCRVARNSAL